MNRTEFIVATAIVLFVAFLLGWFASWLMHRLSRVSQADLGELDQMAQALHEAEVARDQALAYLRDRETDMAEQLHRAEEDARAATRSLEETRGEAEELRDYIERLRRKA